LKKLSSYCGAVILTAGSTGCVPVLTSPGGDTATTEVNCSTWQAPENGWLNTNSPPCDTESVGFERGQLAPDMRLVDQHGATVSLWQFAGTVILLDFSTMWCAPCQDIATHVDDTWKDFEDQGFTYLTILSQDDFSNIPDDEDLNSWAEDYDITAPILSDDRGYTDGIIPPGGGFPQLMLIDRDMIVTIDAIQPVTDPAVRSAIRGAL